MTAGRVWEMEIEMDDRTVRVVPERHWDASDAGDFKVEHEIYREVLCLIICNRASGSAAGTTFKRAEPFSRTESFLRSGKSSVAAISGSLNSSYPMTAYHLTR